VTKDQEGLVHVIYPAIDHSASPGATVLADSHEANGSWRTLTVDSLGKSGAGAGRSYRGFLCFPKPLLASDGLLHVVYYDSERGSLAQAEWKDGRWQDWDVAPARHVVALDVTEVDGQFGVVWADGQAQEVYARFVSLSPPSTR
jgi:hypothetical protein